MDTSEYGSSCKLTYSWMVMIAMLLFPNERVLLQFHSAVAPAQLSLLWFLLLVSLSTLASHVDPA